MNDADLFSKVAIKSIPTIISSNKVIIKELFLHTKLKIYPDGSIFLEIKGKPKGYEVEKKEAISDKYKKETGALEL